MLHPRRPRLPCTALRPLPGCTHSDELPRAVILACGSHGAWFASHTSCPHAHLSGLELEPQGRLTLPDPPAPTGRTNQKKKKCCVDTSAWQGGRRGQRGQGGSVSMLGTGPCHPTSAPGGGMTEHTHLDRALSPPAHGHKTGPRLPPTSTPLHSTGRYKSDTSNMAVVLSTDQGTLLIDWEGEWFRSQCVECSLSFKYMQSTCSTTELHPYRGDFCSFFLHISYCT